MYLGGKDAWLCFRIALAVESMGSVGDVLGNRVCIFQLLEDVAWYGDFKGAFRIILFEAYATV